jgi:phosphoribosyl-AMP cyclohydrolase / phosphoribosyl-ATP pyrophosphohydrolase
MSIQVPDALKYDDQGLLPVIAQDYASGDILMVAFANGEAVRLTGETGIAHFWSRSRGKLWMKGETSGHVLRVREARTDCDRDVLLLVVDPAGPACHTNARTCFGETTATGAGMPAELARTVASRIAARPAGSYTAKLVAEGRPAIARKIEEEVGELIEALGQERNERVAQEAADLLFHVAVALEERKVPVARVLEILDERRKTR